MYSWSPIDRCDPSPTLRERVGRGGLGNDMATRVVYTHEPGATGKLISQHRSGATSYYLYDGLGNTRALADSAGTITDTYVYQAYGTQISETGSTPNNYRYVGRYGYYYDYLASAVPLNMRARNLSTTQARFTSTDPSGVVDHDLNLYLYVRNNPVNDIDPSGRFTQAVPCERGETIECIIRAGIGPCRQGYDCSNIAYELSDRTGLPGRGNGPRDAVRHCLWMCCIAATSGPAAAKIIGDLHEECGPNKPDEICMDLWNNGVGRTFGAGIKGPGKPCQCLTACLVVLSKWY